MDELQYQIGIQTFSTLIEDGYTYIDKTQYIPLLLKQSKFIFLSRPRRFGKSLFLSTLKAYFEGKRDLFKGLAADTMDLDWTPSPVLRFDFNAEDFTQENGLDMLIEGFLRDYEEIYGRRPEDVTISQRFKYLIRTAYEKTGRKVVILIDEYDKPLLEVEHDRELLEKNRIKLKSFFGNLKTMDEFIRFGFITGIARFSKVSIFSDLNNLKDISMDNDFADICGWTEKELVNNFRPNIEVLADTLEENYDSTILSLRNYYDGYLFAPLGSRLYNPYSVLNAFASKEIYPFWFETATPSFFARWVKNNGIDPRKMNDIIATKEELNTVGLDSWNPVPLMFQTGYLTIGSYDKRSKIYELRFPNIEVKIGFFRKLLPIYAPPTANIGTPLDFTNFKRDLAIGHISDFMQRLSILLKDLPGEDHCESTYRAVTYILSVLCGNDTLAEHHSYKGRSDLEVSNYGYVYIFEFKYNNSVKAAMDQIKSRDYAGRYALDLRTVYLIAANFNEKKDSRGLEYEIEKLN